jgi:DNA-binding transcriptional MerR regulator
VQHMGTFEIVGGPEQAWKVGALAKATGLTVRALHHYDHIGLLSPSVRTAAGHRM